MSELKPWECRRLEDLDRFDPDLEFDADSDISVTDYALGWSAGRADTLANLHELTTDELMQDVRVRKLVGWLQCIERNGRTKVDRLIAGIALAEWEGKE